MNNIYQDSFKVVYEYERFHHQRVGIVKTTKNFSFFFSWAYFWAQLCHYNLCSFSPRRCCLVLPKCVIPHALTSTPVAVAHVVQEWFGGLWLEDTAERQLKRRGDDSPPAGMAAQRAGKSSSSKTTHNSCCTNLSVMLRCLRVNFTVTVTVMERSCGVP